MVFSTILWLIFYDWRWDTTVYAIGYVDDDDTCNKVINTPLHAHTSDIALIRHTMVLNFASLPPWQPMDFGRIAFGVFQYEVLRMEFQTDTKVI